MTPTINSNNPVCVCVYIYTQYVYIYIYTHNKTYIILNTLKISVFSITANKLSMTDSSRFINLIHIVNV